MTKQTAIPSALRCCLLIVCRQFAPPIAEAETWNHIHSSLLLLLNADIGARAQGPVSSPNECILP
jgi:hypothetical protein